MSATSMWRGSRAPTRNIDTALSVVPPGLLLQCAADEASSALVVGISLWAYLSQGMCLVRVNVAANVLCRAVAGNRCEVLSVHAIHLFCSQSLLKSHSA